MIYASAVRRIIQASAGIQYVGGKVVISPTTFDTTGLTDGIGTQAEAGDLILIYRFNSAVQSGVLGFTQMQGGARTTTTLKTYFSVEQRVAEAAGESFTSNSSLLAMMVFRGAAVESSVGATAGGGTITPPAITPVAPGAIIVAGGASNNNKIVNSPPAAALYSVVHAPNNGADIGMCVGTTAMWSYTGSHSGSSSCGASIVLAPA